MGHARFSVRKNQIKSNQIRKLSISAQGRLGNTHLLLQRTSTSALGVCASAFYLIYRVRFKYLSRPPSFRT
jgi:hypothetical protein